jgi:transcriptional regulator with XRE-family HTH domain
MNGWTKADIARLRDVMLSQGRGIDEIADEVRSVCNVTRLASYRLAHGLSQPQAVARCRRYGQGNALDQPTLSRLEQFPAKGSRTPLAVQLIALAGAYGTQPLRLLTPDALALLDPREGEVIVRLAGGAVPEHESAEQAELAGLAGSSGLSGLSAHGGLGELGGRSLTGIGGNGNRPGARSGTRPGIRAGVRLGTRPGAGAGSGQTDDDPGIAGRRTDERAPGRLAGAARRAFRFASLVEGSNIGAETLAELEAEVRRLALCCPQQPIGQLVPELTQLQDIGFRLLEGRQRPPQSASLYLLTGMACGMLAKASHDLGDAGSAMTQARAAYVCADNADHHGLRTWVRGLQSLVCYWSGWSQDALRYARLGAESARSVRGASAVWIASQEARAWGMVGNESATVAALNRARWARDRAVDDDLDQIGGVLGFIPARQLYYAADALTAIPEQQATAESLAIEAISAYEKLPAGLRSYADEAGARCDLALVRIRGGDAAGAGEAIGPVLELPVERRINGIVASAHRIAVAAAGLTRTGAGKALREEIEVFCLSPAGEEPV